MKTVRIKIRCWVCKKFEKEIDLDTNEYGFFDVPVGHCPECFCILEQTFSTDIKEIL